jgi:hypothetical protein
MSTSNDITLNTSTWIALGYYLALPVTFNTSLTRQNITICSLANATVNPTLPVILNGINANLYTINNATIANIQVTTFNTTWPLYRALLTFNSTLSSSQRNSLLCYLKNQVNPLFNDYIVKLRGESCSTANSSAPLNEYYVYHNNTDEIGGVQVIYLITQYDTGSPSIPVTNFQNLFDSSTNSTLSAIASAIGTTTGVTLLSGVY